MFDPADHPEAMAAGAARMERNRFAPLSIEYLTPGPAEREAVAAFMAATLEQMDREAVVKMERAA